MSSVESKRTSRIKRAKVQVPFIQATFARNVRDALAAREWSQSELARRSGVSQKHVSNAVRCVTSSSIDVVFAIGRALGIEPGLLLWPGLGNADAARVGRLTTELEDTRGRGNGVHRGADDRSGHGRHRGSSGDAATLQPVDLVEEGRA